MRTNRLDESNDSLSNNSSAEGIDNKGAVLADEETNGISLSKINKKSSSNVISPTTGETDAEDHVVVGETHKSSRFRVAFLSLVCGIEDDHKQTGSSQDEQRILKNNLEFQQRMANFTSLKQTKFEKSILNVNLVFILALAVGLFVFFSIPPELHIFKNVNLNLTHST
jgi:hypothetical protein